MPDDTELDRLDPVPVLCELSTGTTVEVVRMRTRQFFRLLRVLTHGAGPAMMQSGLDFNDGASEFASKLLMLVVMSIPDAETEAIAFLQSMCKPAGLVDKPASQLTKAETEANQSLWEAFNTDLFNPELDDTLDLMEAIVTREAPELQALGKKLERMLKLFRATGQDKEPPEETPTPEQMAQGSPEPSPSPSTSSPTSTGGQTSTSSSSRSAGSAKRSKRPAAAAVTSSTPG